MDKLYARVSLVKIGFRLFPRVSYRQVVLTLPKQLRIPFHNHSNQKRLYSEFMVLAEACLSELILAHFKTDECEIAIIVFIHTHSRNGNYNPHLHVILAKGAFFPSNEDWKGFQYLSLYQLQLLW
ncbi:transposase [Candidatus Enterovibrio escicola]|uniref:transposase n=1 Tax=Candidatus Enterovibrio escicola TaxID=1927127 RepID=UPI00168055B3|nr:transposase [Candidatus Enterovibrio escacola]